MQYLAQAEHGPNLRILEAPVKFKHTKQIILFILSSSLIAVCFRQLRVCNFEDLFLLDAR